MVQYTSFLDKKTQLDGGCGFDPVWMPDFLFDFQSTLTQWALRQGRGACFESPGLGKTPQQLVAAENVVRKTGKNVLIIAPIAVSLQTIREGEKFGIEVKRSIDGVAHRGITVTNYERLEKFNPNDFEAVVADESGAIKDFSSKRQKNVTEFMRKMKYRFLYTATPAPNDYIELGTSSEALGYLGRMDMLAKFFHNDQGSINPQRNYFETEWRLKGHAEKDFWRWVCSWARAVRKPSDMGFSDERFILPPLTQTEHVVKADRPLDGFLFQMPARGLAEQRNERRMTINHRREKVAELVGDKPQSIVWCHLNPEGDLLEEIIPDCVQVSGKDSDDEKEEKLIAFIDGKVKRLVTKPIIAGFGLNMQNCAHMTFFPSHSFEQFFQCIRRCYRFGQKNPVHVDIVSTEGEHNVLKNLQRKEKQAEAMFERLVASMNDALSIQRGKTFTKKEELPKWL